MKTHRYPGEQLLQDLFAAQTDNERAIVLKKIQQRYNFPAQDYLDAAVGHTAEDIEVAQHNVLKRIAYEVGLREIMLGYHHGEDDDGLPSIEDIRDALSRHHHFKNEAASMERAYFVAFSEGLIDGTTTYWRRFRDVIGSIDDRTAIEEVVQFSSEHTLVDEMARTKPELPGPGSRYDLSDEGIAAFAKDRANHSYLRERVTARLLSSALGRIRALAGEKGLGIDDAIAAFRSEVLRESFNAGELGRELARIKGELPLRRSTVERAIGGADVEDRVNERAPRAISF